MVIEMSQGAMATMQQQIRETAACVSSMKNDLTTIKVDMAVLKERSDHEMERCPMRERIRTVENGLITVCQDVLEMRVQIEKATIVAQDNRLNIAQRAWPAALSGTIVAIIIEIAQHLPK